MPKATLTSRVLKNKDSGLEIQVPTFSARKETLSTVVHYQVVLASNLACFKSPSHKESDVVQYSVDRKFNEFENLKNKLTGQFPGTMLPPLNKKSIIVNDAVLRERRACLDNFMKCIASVPTMSTCAHVLVFLGVDRHRAKKFERGEPLDKKSAAATPDQSVIVDDEDDNASGRNDSIVFGEDEDSGNEDFFGDDNPGDGTDDLFKNDHEGGSRPGNIKIFEGQDLKPDLTEDDEKDFTVFIPDAILTKTQTIHTQEQGEEEDNSDLFQIEDDLEQLMLAKRESKKTAEDENAQPMPPAPQATPPKPSPPLKPSIPSKPKPQIASKPKTVTSSQPTSSTSEKPSIPQKPKPSSTSSSFSSKMDSSKESPLASSTIAESAEGAGIGNVGDLGQDDIMKYLQDNLDSNAEEVDLFS